MLEGGIRVPFAVQWTGRLPANVIYDDMVSSLDILATARCRRVALPTDRAYDGLNIVPFLGGRQPARPNALSRSSAAEAVFSRQKRHDVRPS